jgi:hypothetical protein
MYRSEFDALFPGGAPSAVVYARVSAVFLPAASTQWLQI